MQCLLQLSWAEPDFRYLRREVGIHSIPKLVLRRQKSGGTNQIAVSVAVARNTYLRLREAHYRPPVATGIRMAEETKERILLAGGLLGYPSIKQEQVDVARAFLEGTDVFAVLPTGFGKSRLCVPTCSTRYREESERGYYIV